MSKISPQSNFFCESHMIGAPFTFKIPTQGTVLYVNFLGVALLPPILGLNNDRCKILGGDRDLNPYRISDQTIPFSDPIAPSIKIYTVSQTKPIKIYTFQTLLMKSYKIIVNAALKQNIQIAGSKFLSKVNSINSQKA